MHCLILPIHCSLGAHHHHREGVGPLLGDRLVKTPKPKNPKKISFLPPPQRWILVLRHSGVEVGGK